VAVNVLVDTSATDQALGGAVADDGGTQTDETTAANDATTDDMTLLPASPAVRRWNLDSNVGILERNRLDCP